MYMPTIYNGPSKPRLARHDVRDRLVCGAMDTKLDTACIHLALSRRAKPQFLLLFWQADVTMFYWLNNITEQAMLELKIFTYLFCWRTSIFHVYQPALRKNADFFVLPRLDTRLQRLDSWRVDIYPTLAEGSCDHTSPNWFKICGGFTPRRPFNLFLLWTTTGRSFLRCLHWRPFIPRYFIFPVEIGIKMRQKRRWMTNRQADFSKIFMPLAEEFA